ncbi:MAG TPA: NADH-quinone oxidoreductase subunit C [Acidimicrobiia bacterium]|jgi:NADH-quinone oxidoreductase subunit C
MADDTAREEDHEPAVNGGPAPEPVSDEVAAAIVARFEGSVFVESHGQPVVYVDRSVIADVARLLRDEEQFTMLIDTVVVDHLLDGSRVRIDGIPAERFEVVVNFLSHPRNRRIRIVCEVPAADPTVPSLTPVYPGANFPERESYDLFGVVFDGHPDLTRILMPDDWHGHPLRKDDAAARVPVTFKGDPSPR